MVVDANEQNPDRLLCEQEDFEDILEGAALLAAGGGGPKSIAKLMLNQLLKMNTSITLVDPVKGASGNEYVTCVFGFGSPEEILTKKLTSLYTKAPKKAFDLQAKLLIEKERREFDKEICKPAYISAIETGAINTFCALLAAAQTNIALIDADGAGGRSIPQFDMCSYDIAGVSVIPTAFATDLDIPAVSITDGGDIKTTSDLSLAVKNLVRTPKYKKANDTACVSTWTTTVDKFRNCSTSNTISLAREIGETLRLQKAEEASTGSDKGDLYATKVIEVMKKHGWYSELLLTGTFKTIKKCEDGKLLLDFNEATLIDETTGEYALILGLNENICMYKGTTNEVGRVVYKTPMCLGPDKICFLSRDGVTLTAEDIKVGLEVDVIGIQAPDDYVDLPKSIDIWNKVMKKITEVYVKNNNETQELPFEYIPLKKLDNRANRAPC